MQIQRGAGTYLVDEEEEKIPIDKKNGKDETRQRKREKNQE